MFEKNDTHRIHIKHPFGNPTRRLFVVQKKTEKGWEDVSVHKTQSEALTKFEEVSKEITKA